MTEEERKTKWELDKKKAEAAANSPKGGKKKKKGVGFWDWNDVEEIVLD